MSMSSCALNSSFFKITHAWDCRRHFVKFQTICMSFFIVFISPLFIELQTSNKLLWLAKELDFHVRWLNGVENVIFMPGIHVRNRLLPKSCKFIQGWALKTTRSCNFHISKHFCIIFTQHVYVITAHSWTDFHARLITRNRDSALYFLWYCCLWRVVVPLFIR